MKTTSKRDREFALRLGALLSYMLSFGSAQSVIKALDSTDLSFVHFKALVVVGNDDDEKTSVKYIAEQLDASLPSASRIVDCLVKKELVTRVEDPDDRRVRLVSVTPAGQKIVDGIITAQVEGMERFLGELEPEERQVFQATLDVVMRRPELMEAYRRQADRVFS